MVTAAHGAPRKMRHGLRRRHNRLLQQSLAAACCHSDTILQVYTLAAQWPQMPRQRRWTMEGRHWCTPPMLCSKRPFCPTTNAIDAMEVSHYQLPVAVFNNATIGKYRDAVCRHLHLRLKRCSGSGNCFFESCALLLPSLRLDANTLRQQAIAFLRECVHAEHGALGERCLFEIESELNEELIGAKKQTFPLTPEAYLNASASNRVWVAGMGLGLGFWVCLGLTPQPGYHWVRAVSALHQVCIGVVIHGFEHVTLFGDSALPRVYVYKKDAETHYDALLPVLHPLSSEEVSACVKCTPFGATSHLTSRFPEVMPS